MKTTLSTIELSRMTQTELRRDIAVARTEYAAMRMGVEMQTEKNHARFKAKRRDIARMSTVLTALGANQGNEKNQGKQKKQANQKSNESASQDVKKTLQSRGSSKAK